MSNGPRLRSVSVRAAIHAPDRPPDPPWPGRAPRVEGGRGARRGRTRRGDERGDEERQRPGLVLRDVLAAAVRQHDRGDDEPLRLPAARELLGEVGEGRVDQLHVGVEDDRHGPLDASTPALAARP